MSNVKEFVSKMKKKSFELYIKDPNVIHFPHLVTHNFYNDALLFILNQSRCKDYQMTSFFIPKSS